MKNLTTQEFLSLSWNKTADNEEHFPLIDEEGVETGELETLWHVTLTCERDPTLKVSYYSVGTPDDPGKIDEQEPGIHIEGFIIVDEEGDEISDFEYFVYQHLMA